MTNLKNVNFIPSQSFDNKVTDTKEDELYLVRQGFLPSEKYVDVSWTNSGRYIAPADGVFVANLAFNASNINRGIDNVTTGYNEMQNTYNSGAYGCVVCPTRKGDSVYTWVSSGGTLTGSANSFRFYYY